MAANKTLRYTRFAALYFVQGAILSYFTALNALYLLSFDVSMSQIGLFSAIALSPFILKIFLGMLSDRVNLFGRGYRKPYIVLGLLVQTICLLLAPSINPGTHFSLFALLAFILMTGMALYDTSTDGLALDTTPPEEQGTIQGFMVGGRALGVVLISAVIGLLAQLASWRAAFWSLAFLTLIPLILVIRLEEPRRLAGRIFEWRAFRAFRRAPILALALLGALYSLAIYGANEIINPFLQDQFGIDYITAGFYTAVWGAGVVLGGLTGGRLADRLGHLSAARWAIIASMLTITSLALIGSPGMAWPLMLLFGLSFGYYDTIYLVAAMECTDPRIAASMFSILMAVANIGTGIGFAVSGGLVDAVGYNWTFVLLAAFSLVALLFLPVIFRSDRAAPVMGS
jgi:PAT family beta-lactamase induction signal transducer AmpG